MARDQTRLNFPNTTPHHQVSYLPIFLPTQFYDPCFRFRSEQPSASNPSSDVFKEAEASVWGAWQEYVAAEFGKAAPLPIAHLLTP